MNPQQGHLLREHDDVYMLIKKYDHDTIKNEQMNKGGPCRKSPVKVPSEVYRLFKFGHILEDDETGPCQSKCWKQTKKKQKQ